MSLSRYRRFHDIDGGRDTCSHPSFLDWAWVPGKELERIVSIFRFVVGLSNRTKAWQRYWHSCILCTDLILDGHGVLFRSSGVVVGLWAYAA